MLSVPAWAQEVPSNYQTLYTVQKVMQEARDKVVQTGKQTPQEIAESGGLAAAPFWNSHGVSPLTGTKGMGARISDSFGFAQLLCAVTGISKADRLLMALRVDMNKDWTLSDVHITPTVMDNVAAVQVFTPNLPPFAAGDTTYTHRIVFPLFVDVEKSNQELALSLSVKGTACQGQKCAPIALSVPLKIEAGKSYPSPYRPYILTAFSYVSTFTSLRNNFPQNDAPEHPRAHSPCGHCAPLPTSNE